MTDTASFLGRSLVSDEDRPKLPTIKWDETTDAHTLTIVETGMVQQTKFSKDPNAPKVYEYWDNGDPKMMLGITATTESGEEVRAYIKGKRMTAAVAKAVKAAGKDDLEPGGKLWIKFTGWVAATLGDAKDFTAKYQPPASSSPTASFLGDAAGAGDAPPF